MMPKKEFYKKQAATIISQFALRGIEGHYCRNANEAKELALSMMEDGASVAWGGSESIKEIGLLDAVKSSDRLEVIDRADYKTPEQQRELKGKIAMSDYFLMSSNAITLDGQLVNIDGAGSRLSYLIYGPENVIVIAGMNKVAATVEDAIHRVQNIASPPNTMRLGCDTPCAKTGKCGNCISDATICCQVVITRRSRINNRIKVILVGEELGF
ncbi:MAG: lactate utilization protein [Lachnospiraceae bacterium]|nr:lactate utilization protein [Lachnospiraceae bacterium]